MLTADPATAVLIRDLVHRLFARAAQVNCEDRVTPRPGSGRRRSLSASPTTTRRILLRALLDDAGLTSVMVDTANRLQGLTFEVVIAWHPLAGSPVTDAFHLDPGRLCVLLTRHRQACIVVGRDTDRASARGGFRRPRPASWAGTPIPFSTAGTPTRVCSDSWNRM